MVRVQLALEQGREVFPVVVGVGHVVHDLLPEVGLLGALAVNHLALGLLESGRVRLSLRLFFRLLEGAREAFLVLAEELMEKLVVTHDGGMFSHKIAVLIFHNVLADHSSRGVV